MQIELFGCSSAGKSSLAPRILRAARSRGVPASMSEDFVLRQLGLDGIRSRWLRTPLVDLMALGSCVALGESRRDFLRFAWRSARALPVGWPRRLNTARNVLKKTAIRELIRRRASPREIVVMDEGTLQTAHYLFVQPHAPPDLARLEEFLKRVPLPDVAVYVRETEAELVRRTARRGHARLRQASETKAAAFVAHALRSFAAIAAHARVRARLIVLDRPVGSLAAATGAEGPQLEQALEIVRAALAVGRRVEVAA